MGVKVIPPCYLNYEFEDAIKNEALQATYSNRSVDDIRDAVIKHAAGLRHCADATSRCIFRGWAASALALLAIEADYSVPLELPGYSTTIDFHPSSKNKGVY